MNYLQQRIMSAQLAKARKALENVNSPFTVYPEIYMEQALNILNSSISKLNKG